jgi:hypothetical protein
MSTEDGQEKALGGKQMEITDLLGTIDSDPISNFRESRYRDSASAGDDVRPASLRLFSGIVETWNISDETALQLLALTPGTSIRDIDPVLLSEEQLLRISCLIAIYKALHIYWQNELADRWVRLANSNAMFGGRSPSEYMSEGGLPALRSVRNLLEGWCEGNE